MKLFYHAYVASEAYGVSRAWVHRMVCVPLPPFQGNPSYESRHSSSAPRLVN